MARRRWYLDDPLLMPQLWALQALDSLRRLAQSDTLSARQRTACAAMAVRCARLVDELARQAEREPPRPPEPEP